MDKFTSIEQMIRNLMVEEAEGTIKRRMIKNVGRPDDGAPMSEKSKVAKQGEIKTKIIDERKKLDKEDLAQFNAAGTPSPANDQQAPDWSKIDFTGAQNAPGSNLKLPNVWKNTPAMFSPKMPKVNEAAMPMDDVQSNGKDNSDVGNVKDVKKKNNVEDKKDPKKIKGGKTEVIVDPVTDDKVNNETDEDNVSKKARTKANKEIGAKSVKEETHYHVSWGPGIEHQLIANDPADATAKAKAHIIKNVPKLTDPKYSDTFSKKPVIINLTRERKLQKENISESYEPEAAAHMKKSMKCYESGDMKGYHIHMHNYHHTMAHHHAKHHRHHVADAHVKKAIRHLEEAAKFGPLDTPGPDGKPGRHSEMANDAIKASARSSHADAPFEPDDASTTIKGKTKNIARNLARSAMKAMIVKKTVKEQMYGGMNDSNATEKAPTKENTYKKTTTKKIKGD
jgi:hypothetical protein